MNNMGGRETLTGGYELVAIAKISLDHVYSNFQELTRSCALEVRVIVIIKIIIADNLVSSLLEMEREMETNKASSAGDNNPFNHNGTCSLNTPHFIMLGMDEQPPVIAAFDFDKTISTRDTLIPFLIFLHGWVRVFLGTLRLLPYFFAYFLGFATRKRTKERVFEEYFFGMETVDYQRHAQEFSKEKLDHLIRPKARSRIEWHRNQGHRLIIVSAAVGCYLEDWAEVNGFESVVASRLESKSGRITGRLRGENCRCEEKVRRLMEYLETEEKDFTLYAYGDSRGDKELLGFADYPFYRFL